MFSGQLEIDCHISKFQEANTRSAPRDACEVAGNLLVQNVI